MKAEISKTDILNTIRFLEIAIGFLRPLSPASSKATNQIRLIKNLIHKLKSKIPDEKK